MSINKLPVSSNKIEGTENLTDPVQKFRVSTAQSLIDTDFEYGTQITKWENVALTDNRPFVFNTQAPISTVTAMSLPQGSKTVTITFASGAPAVGTAISVQDSFLPIANGNYLIETSNGTTSATYTASSVNTSTLTSIFDGNKTLIFVGNLYTQAQIGEAPTSVTYSGLAVTVTTTIPHNLSLGNEIGIRGLTASTNPPNGSFTVSTIVSSTSFIYYAEAQTTGTIAFGSAAVYTQPQGNFLHRPFDGGVIFSSNSQSNYQSAVRQTRRYFRYQSGKGIQISSGTVLKPSLQLDALSYDSGTGLCTVRTKERHNLLPGSEVVVYGATEAGYNGTFSVYTITGYDTFTYTPVTTPTAVVASGPYYATVSNWFGCVNRLGMYDQQNGLFFEFDGTTLYAVRRSSTYQIAGKSSATQGSCTVTQTSSAFPTFYSKQLTVGQYIVIRGISYRVTDIASDTSMTISPAYRGNNILNSQISMTVDTKVPQSQWNLDKFDGTGKSGYNIDLKKMQMFYIDYSWYGAGSIRWGMRAANGEVIYCHKMANNNVNAESYMRSGNLPARYESTTEPFSTYTTANVGTADTTINVSSTLGFPTAGTLRIGRASTGYEFINYTGISSTSFTGCTRAKAGATGVTLTGVAGVNTVTVVSSALMQVGMRVISAGGVPDGCYIAIINSGTSITLSSALTSTNPTATIAPMGLTTGTAFTYSTTNPVQVTYAFPTYAPSISHWGTSVMMDGRYDDDKSLIFTYGQKLATSISAGGTNALFAIRVSPSVDNGQTGVFGARELVNRMQLILNALDVTTTTANANLLVTAILNGTPSASRTFTAIGSPTSSLAQIADYQGGAVATVSGGEVTGGFFVGTGANSIDLGQVRDLGNSVLGGGAAGTQIGFYPDGPDTLHIMVTNLGATTVSVFGRLSWKEAQA
jgi:hypothetical protein